MFCKKPLNRVWRLRDSRIWCYANRLPIYYLVLNIHTAVHISCIFACFTVWKGSRFFFAFNLCSAIKRIHLYICKCLVLCTIIICKFDLIFIELFSTFLQKMLFGKSFADQLHLEIFRNVWKSWIHQWNFCRQKSPNNSCLQHLLMPICHQNFWRLKNRYHPQFQQNLPWN